MFFAVEQHSTIKGNSDGCCPVMWGDHQQEHGHKSLSADARVASSDGCPESC